MAKSICSLSCLEKSCKNELDNLPNLRAICSQQVNNFSFLRNADKECNYGIAHCLNIYAQTLVWSDHKLILKKTLMFAGPRRTSNSTRIKIQSEKEFWGLLRFCGQRHLSHIPGLHDTWLDMVLIMSIGVYFFFWLLAFVFVTWCICFLPKGTDYDKIAMLL